MQSQTIPKETFIIVIFGGMIRRYDSGYGSGYDSWVWFAELELPTLTKICTPEKKTQPYLDTTFESRSTMVAEQFPLLSFTIASAQA